MAQFNGYVSIPHSTFDEWKTSVIGNGYDADLTYGNQCWDLCAEFWWNIGFSTGYPLSNTGVTMHGVWGMRVQNAGNKFDLIYDKQDIKRGDVIVLGGDGNGHICFADEDYSQAVDDKIYCVGQGQGSEVTSRAQVGLDAFAGAFRYRGWHGEPPVPPIVRRRGKFPWVLYARKLRESQKF